MISTSNKELSFQLYQAGWRPVQIANKLGLTSMSVCRHLINQGIILKRNGNTSKRKLLPVHMLIVEYANGAGFTNLAKKYKVSKQTIKMRVLSLGIALKNRCVSSTNASQRDWHYRSKFGITLVDYNNLVTKQANLCAICKGACSTKRNLAVDHCHKTGKIRGLLCRDCNAALGYFHDDTKRLRQATEYLAGGI